MNKFRLTTNSKSNLFNKQSDKIKEINLKLLELFSLPTPYIIVGVNKYLRDTNKLVSEKVGIITTDQQGNKQNYISISKCSRALGFARLTIKNY